MQSVHDGWSSPMNLCGCRYISKHPGCDRRHLKNIRWCDLIDNEWLHLLHIEPESHKTFRRRSGGVYEPV